MDTFVKADVFFLVTTGAVIIVTIAIVIFAYYAIRTVRAMHLLVTKVHGHVDGLEQRVNGIKREVVAKTRFAVRVVRSVASILMEPPKKRKDISVESDF